jgi:hypothetical protein
MTPTAVRNLFASAAIFNALAGRQVSVLFGMPSPPNLLFTQIAGMAVLLFGYGYWLEVRYPRENRSLVAIGALGKVGIFLLAAGHVVAGTVNCIFPALAAADLIYAFLFFRYLAAAF